MRYAIIFCMLAIGMGCGLEPSSDTEALRGESETPVKGEWGGPRIDRIEGGKDAGTFTDSILIHGSDLLGATVELDHGGKRQELAVLEAFSERIRAALPSGVQAGPVDVLVSRMEQSDRKTLWLLRGDDGDQGEKGEAGEKGEKGDTGSPGIPGQRGEKGEKGDKGDRGDKGDKGNQGEPGLQGPQGSTGAKGATGAKGDPGAKGKDAVQDYDILRSGTTGSVSITGSWKTIGTAKTITAAAPTDLLLIGEAMVTGGTNWATIGDVEFSFKVGSTMLGSGAPLQIQEGQTNSRSLFARLRVGAGNHTIQLQARCLNGGSCFGGTVPNDHRMVVLQLN